MLFTFSQAVVIVQIMQQTATYYAGTGAKCLLCGTEKAPTEHTFAPDWVSLTRMRYHKCRCGHSFKSVEKIEKTAENVEIRPKTPKKQKKR